ncbi:murein DD-endopeptidase MepM/ murein hydrolase activator NlpD [Kribbella amoyensis]|uniref:Murein DD-endopeptidase MepM/ murein hydrolase activator NlpD n=1 Tax=Kribbella amoyensis TaxID=996641 RepID=A0A561BTP3_9ACTN|nr:M23 family metallopeptidase [Kribbella amoyensis]TWD82290.1 murein DD-endopeptidase MepM/ murein hydrolase activator NlpD [Kribbella amoyensis]
MVPSAQAEPPDPQAKKKQLDSQINQSKADLHESYDQLSKSVAAYNSAEAQYKAVQARYAAAQGKLAAAKAADVVAANKLKAAEQALTTAQGNVADGEKAIAEKTQLAGRAVRSAYQQQNSLVGLSIVLRGASPTDLATGMQVQRNVFGIQGKVITGLNNAQAQLANKRAKLAEAERQVAAQRAEAARTVQEVTRLTQQVAADKAAAAQVTATRMVAYQAAEKDKNAELSHYNSLVAERGRVEQILIARARAEKAAAARRKAAKEAAERAKAKKENRPPRPVPDDPGNDGGLSFPINTYITSPYGMRFHPILKYWKLHDGTDFGAGCGTPIRAAASGTVTDRYYNGGYGNRIFISHGVIGGDSITTVYNHLSRYKARVGQHVRKGQVIGYVGSTGYSTGCHLHFMVYRDGRVVNPMKYL